MDETSAKAVAAALGGGEWHSGGGLWLVLIVLPDGRVVSISDELVCLYRDRDAFNDGDRPENAIELF
jgi:hypothetical protein